MRSPHRRSALFTSTAALGLGLIGAIGCQNGGSQGSDDLIPGWTPNPLPPLTTAACENSAAGREVGDLAEDFMLLDQSGEPVRLSDYCGKVVYLALGAMWCTECIKHAEAIVDLLDQFGDEKLVVLTLMTENPDFEPPEKADLETWAKTFGLPTPVLSDEGWQVWDRYYRYHAAPGQLLIGADGRIRKQLSIDSPHEVTAEDIEAAITAR